MKPPRPALRELARSLLEDEAGGQAEAAGAGLGAEEVFHRLGERLGDLIGARGYEALLGRALKLAKDEVAALAPVEVTPDGALHGLADASAERSAPEVIEAATCLLAHFLELLATFIGADLTTQLAISARRGDGERDDAAEGT
jgi:hypothetical protein